MAKITVIVPVYNMEKYIERCLKSLLSQTLEDIEIIVVNDGSTDKSKEIILDFLESYGNIIYKEKENEGVAVARNYGLKAASGEYITFLDPDDYIEKDMYEKMYNKAKEEEEEADLVECDFYWEYPNKKKQDVGKVYLGKKDMLVNVRVMPWNKLIKKSIIQDNNIRFPKGLKYEDVEFTYKLVPYCNKVSFVKKPFVHYMQREDSASYSYNEKVADIFLVLDDVIEYYRSNGIYEEYKEELEYVYTRYLLCSSFKRITKIKDKAIKEKLLFETWKNLNEKFPNWKKNKILNKQKSKKNLYIKSVNKTTFKIYSKIF